MAVGDTLPNCDGTGTQQDPYIFTTEQGLKEAIAVSGAYVEAGENNLVFDVNNGVLDKHFRFNGYRFNGKGLTIRNLYVNSSEVSDNYDMIKINNHGGIVSNTNFYNCYMYVDTYSIYRLISGSEGHTYWNNCNFTCIMKLKTGASSTYLTYVYEEYIHFTDCTFNINMDVERANYSSGFSLIGDSRNHNVFTNCTLCFSGKVHSTSASSVDLFLTSYSEYKNCTFMNSSSNPLIVGSDASHAGRITMTFGDGSTQNYIKLYATGLGATNYFETGTDDSEVLLNVSKLTNFNVSGGCIKMQETNPSGDDYIYSAANLASNNFTVGTEVE